MSINTQDDMAGITMHQSVLHFDIQSWQNLATFALADGLKPSLALTPDRLTLLGRTSVQELLNIVGRSS